MDSENTPALYVVPPEHVLAAARRRGGFITKPAIVVDFDTMRNGWEAAQAEAEKQGKKALRTYDDDFNVRITIV